MPALTRREFLRLSVLSVLGMSTPLLLSALPSRNVAARNAAAGTKTATPLPPATKSMLGLFALMNPDDDQIDYRDDDGHPDQSYREHHKESNRDME